MECMVSIEKNQIMPVCGLNVARGGALSTLRWRSIFYPSQSTVTDRQRPGRLAQGESLDSPYDQGKLEIFASFR